MSPILFDLYFGFHIALFFLALEIGGRCVFWWQQLRFENNHFADTAAVIALFSIAILVWMGSLFLVGFEHRRVGPPLATFIDFILLTAFIKAMQLLWHGEYRNVRGWRLLGCIIGRVISYTVITLVSIAYGAVQ